MNEMRDAIVVGIDGSEESEHAMSWAYDEAAMTDRRVHLVHVASDYAYTELVDTLMRDEFAREAQALVDKATAASPEDLAVTAGWIWGVPARVLVEASDEASMVVVGTHGRGGYVGAMLGSVSQHVTRLARCPVAVVRSSNESGKRVVVGLDPGAPDPALRVAFEQASGRGLPLTVIRAWHVPPIAGPGLGVPSAGFDADDVERAVRGPAQALVEKWSDKFPGVTADLQLTRGNGSHVLVEESRGADLVVVGSHGRGWFTGMLLGSTSAAVAAHAHCTVLIAR